MPEQQWDVQVAGEAEASHSHSHNGNHEHEHDHQGHEHAEHSHSHGDAHAHDDTHDHAHSHAHGPDHGHEHHHHHVHDDSVGSVSLELNGDLDLDKVSQGSASLSASHRLLRSVSLKGRCRHAYNSERHVAGPQGGGELQGLSLIANKPASGLNAYRLQPCRGPAGDQAMFLACESIFRGHLQWVVKGSHRLGRCWCMPAGVISTLQH